MHRHRLACLSAGLLIALCSAVPLSAQELSRDAERVVGYLLQDWQRQFSSTSIPHAMEFIGVEANDDTRLEIAEHLRANGSLAKNLQWWGANNYIFTNDEKRLAKYLILAHEHGAIVPSAATTAAALEIEADELQDRLWFMARAGFLEAAPQHDLGFSLAAGFKRWAGPLQHNFHTLRVEGEAPLDVW